MGNLRWLSGTFLHYSCKQCGYEWRVESPIFGKHKLNWKFDEFMDQQKMIEKIENDLEIYQSNIMQKYM